MRFQLVLFTSVFALIASQVMAHVQVTPAESRAGVQQTYAVRIPTEGKVATVSVELEIPNGLEVLSSSSGTEVKRDAGHIVSIIWKGEIAPGQVREFTFEAINPAQIQNLVWKAHQHFADGSVSDWIEAKGERHPASVTQLH